jgi:hypothetical protein
MPSLPEASARRGSPASRSAQPRPRSGIGVRRHRSRLHCRFRRTPWGRYALLFRSWQTEREGDRDRTSAWRAGPSDLGSHTQRRDARVAGRGRRRRRSGLSAACSQPHGPHRGLRRMARGRTIMDRVRSDRRRAARAGLGLRTSAPSRIDRARRASERRGRALRWARPSGPGSGRGARRTSARFQDPSPPGTRNRPARRSPTPSARRRP